MSRTAEETARLADGIETMTPEGRALICQAGEGNGPLDVLLFHQGCTVPDPVHLALAADLAEARAEVAALRGNVSLLAEWQAAKRVEEQLLRLQTTAEFGELATARRAWEAAAVAREAIESRMLAADLGEEVGRG